MYVVHVMSKSAVESLKQARARGPGRIVGEALAAGLGRDGSTFRHQCFEHAAGHILSPPLRPDPSTPLHLMNALAQ